jgi:hypothetical protein
VVESAPRIDKRLVAALAVLGDSREPVAEINRRVGRLATELGLPRPSYAQIRRLLRAERVAQEERRVHRGHVAEVIILRRHAYERLGR